MQGHLEGALKMGKGKEGRHGTAVYGMALCCVARHSTATVILMVGGEAAVRTRARAASTLLGKVQRCGLYMWASITVVN